MLELLQSLESRDNGRIDLKAAPDLCRVIVSVTDSGPGIPEEDIAQIFIPFFTTKRQGSGIGLSLCRQIMTAHGGEIAVDSSQQGTTVRLVFN